MRSMCILSAATIVFFGHQLYGDGLSQAAREFDSSQIDAQIKDVKEQIEIYQNRAFYTDREAQRLMTRDFFAYRQYLLERDRDLATVESLKKELNALERQRARQL